MNGRSIAWDEQFSSTTKKVHYFENFKLLTVLKTLFHECLDGQRIVHEASIDFWLTEILWNSCIKFSTFYLLVIDPQNVASDH